jgi:hypothetical protein
MKKITLVLFTFLVFQLGNAQQTISFEASEGFTLGSINGQNGWVVTGCGLGCFIENQTINSDYATNGSNSLKVSVDPAFGPQDPIMGGFYDLASPVDYETAIISYDIYITNHVQGDDSDFRFGMVGEDEIGDPFFTFLIDFNFQGNINVVNDLGTAFVSIGTWTNDTWYNVRAEVTGSVITYFIDDVEVFESLLMSDYDFTAFRFVHDNWGGDAYLDNVRINNEELSVEEFDNNTFKHFYNKDTDVLSMTSSTLAFDNVELYNLLGQQVLNRRLSQTNETVNMSSLEDGVYLAKVSIQGRIQTVKILKN